MPLSGFSRAPSGQARIRDEIGRLVRNREFLAALSLYDLLRPTYLLNPAFAADNAEVATYAERFDIADRELSRAILLAPGRPEVQLRRAMTRLMTGQWASGWEDFEARLALPDVARFSGIRGKASGEAIPRWEPKNPVPERLLVFGEQGLGDTIQFLRFLGPLTERSVVTLVEREALRPVVRAVSERINFVGHDGIVTRDQCDAWVYLMSLPRVLGIHRPDQLDGLPYITSSSRPESTLRRVGICWQGNPEHKNDACRSAPLAVFAPLFDLPGMEFVSLQVGAGLNQVAEAPFRGRLQCPWKGHVPPGGFAETMRIIETLDVVVCVDTAIAHLAGAMGKPVFLVLCASGTDWRWLTQRSDTPWYNRMRIVRQPTFGDWRGAIEKVRDLMVGLPVAPDRP